MELTFQWENIRKYKIGQVQSMLIVLWNRAKSKVEQVGLGTLQFNIAQSKEAQLRRSYPKEVREWSMQKEPLMQRPERGSVPGIFEKQQGDPSVE